VDTPSKLYLSLEDCLLGNIDDHWRSVWSTTLNVPIYVRKDSDTTTVRPSDFVGDAYDYLYSRPNLAVKDHRIWNQEERKFLYVHARCEGITQDQPEDYEPGGDSEVEPEETAGPSTSTGRWSHREPSRPRADTAHTRASTPDRFAPPDNSPRPAFASMEGRIISMSDTQLQTLVQTLTDKTGKRESDRACIRAPTPSTETKRRTNLSSQASRTMSSTPRRTTTRSGQPSRISPQE